MSHRVPPFGHCLVPKDCEVARCTAVNIFSKLTSTLNMATNINEGNVSSSDQAAPPRPWSHPTMKGRLHQIQFEATENPAKPLLSTGAAPPIETQEDYLLVMEKLKQKMGGDYLDDEAGSDAFMKDPSTLTTDNLDHVGLQWSPLTHAEECPARHGTFERVFDEASGEPMTCHPRYVEPALAASILIVSPKHGVLLTKRHRNMRAFPSVWVLPGGHVDANEHIVTAAVREIREEVGDEIADNLVLPDSAKRFADPTTAPKAGSAEASAPVPFFGVWESTYRVEPSPKVHDRHHFIVFFAWVVEGDEDNKPPAVTLQEVECEAHAWVKPTWKVDEASGQRECIFEGLDQEADLAEGTRFMLKALATHGAVTPGVMTQTYSACDQ